MARSVLASATRSRVAIILAALFWLTATSCKNGPVREGVSHKDDWKAAYIYAFPMVMNYGVMYETAIDKNSSQYEARFNQIRNEARVFTPKDTAVISANSDTPYSSVWMDLRTEPIDVPVIESIARTVLR
jgi:hypothetical protein